MGTENSNEATSASDWRGRKGAPLALPSGNTALVRNPGIQYFLRTGTIPNSLKSMIQKSMNEGPGQKMENLFSNEDDLFELFDLMDKIVLQVVIEPKVEPVPTRLVEGTEDGRREPIPLEERDQSVIYIDEVDLEDKAFIFQYAMGGTRDLEQFRNETKDSVAALQASQDVEQST